MFSKIIVFVASIMLLSSCVTGPKEYFKKSANNKLFDMKGFQGGKRAPLYNKKYIARAKQNVAVYGDDDDDDGDYSEDELLENENISRANRDMYRYMLEKDVESKYLGKNGRAMKKSKAYPSVVQTSSRLDDTEYTENLELRAELEQIKVMLNETKNEMANYRCPTASEIERAQERSSSKGKTEKAKSTSKLIGAKHKAKAKPKSIDKNKSDSTVIKPVAI